MCPIRKTAVPVSLAYFISSAVYSIICETDPGEDSICAVCKV
jgi:hypothetical protein